MKLSTRARYGLRALIFLAQQNPGDTVSVREIGENENISVDYLEHLLHAMKQKGLVDSLRGASGGFKLARPAAEIALKDLFVALDEKIQPVWCLKEDETCPRMEQCSSRVIWDKFGKFVGDFLAGTTLADAAGPR
jgi:Rrf2 family protein